MSSRSPYINCSTLSHICCSSCSAVVAGKVITGSRRTLILVGFDDFPMLNNGVSCLDTYLTGFVRLGGVQVMLARSQPRMYMGLSKRLECHEVRKSNKHLTPTAESGSFRKAEHHSGLSLRASRFGFVPFDVIYPN